MDISHFVFIIAGFLNISAQYKIAMCITGMPARFQPQHLKSFFENNSDISFHLFYRFQETNSLAYNTDPSLIYSPSIYSTYNQSFFEFKTFEVYKQIPNVYIESIKYSKGKSRNDWLKIMNQNFEAIRQFVYKQDAILNTYEKADHCAQDVIQFKQNRNTTFAYVIYTREDIYLFKDLNIRKVIAKYHKCDWIGKNCLVWGGLSQRFAIMPFDIGIKFISTKIDYFKYLIHLNKSVYNTEIFDLQHSKKLGMKTCSVSIEDIPATAARHKQNGSFCFIPAEIRGCIPAGFDQFVSNHSCKKA
jgi:hypothetical protein